MKTKTIYPSLVAFCFYNRLPLTSVGIPLTKSPVTYKTSQMRFNCAINNTANNTTTITIDNIAQHSSPMKVNSIRIHFKLYTTTKNRYLIPFPIATGCTCHWRDGQAHSNPGFRLCRPHQDRSINTVARINHRRKVGILFFHHPGPAVVTQKRRGF